MSVKALVTPEDPTHNGYILKPLMEMVLADAGKPSAKVTILTNPKTRWLRPGRNGGAGPVGFTLRLHGPLAVLPRRGSGERQCDGGPRSQTPRTGRQPAVLPGEPEVEVYASVAYRDEIGMDWRTEVRTHRQFKERVFTPLLAKYGDTRMPGGGRGRMTAESIRSRSRFFRLCPEIRRLRDRVADVLR